MTRQDQFLPELIIDSKSTTEVHWPRPAWSLDDVRYWFANEVSPNLECSSAYAGYKQRWTHEYLDLTSENPSQGAAPLVDAHANERQGNAVVHQTLDPHVDGPHNHHPLVVAQHGTQRKATPQKAAAFEEGDQDIHDKMYLWHQNLYNVSLLFWPCNVLLNRLCSGIFMQR